MKDYLQVQKNRIKNHIQPSMNTVHRSSLIAPNMPKSNTWISFINHFLIKRGYKSIALKISAIDKNGKLLSSQTMQVEEPRVYSFNLTKMFSNTLTKNFLVDFFSEKNLFVPFPAVIISHVGKDFCNTVHSYNRVLNDVFEDDEINKTHVSESSFDLKINKKYDTFFNFSSGISDIKNENIFITYKKNNTKISKKLKVSLPRLSYKTFFLSKILSKNLDGGVVKIKQPTQKMFYGRLLAGRINKTTGAFSANHSYYDSSSKKEYFLSKKSFRIYPYFKEFNNKITMYPVFSPSKLNISLKIYSKNKIFISPKFNFSSTSSIPLSINVNQFVKSEDLKNVSAFEVIANTTKNRIPTRVNHQLIYGGANENNSLKCSINVSLTNKTVFVPKYKKGFAWGQIVNHKDYNSKIGLCFRSPEGEKDKIKITFYNSKGQFKSIKKILNPAESLILDANKIFNKTKDLEFIWYVANSPRHDLSAYAAHINKFSENSSGEHNF